MEFVADKYSWAEQRRRDARLVLRFAVFGAPI